MQCRGVTTKGLRCQINSKDPYCHHHKKQANPKYAQRLVVSSNGRSNKTSVSNNGNIVRVSLTPKYIPPIVLPHGASSIVKSGFIYVYTLTDLLTLSEKLWLTVQNLPNSKRRDQDKWKPFNSKKCDWTFVKVGMTTQTVSQRLVQWERKCSHSLTCLQPNVRYFKMSFLDRFKSLSIKNYHTYRDNGFYCNQAATAESEIHQRLREIYGKGEVYCSGCAPVSPQDSNKQYKIHVEWFLVPKKEIPIIFEVIDEVCKKYI